MVTKSQTSSEVINTSKDPDDSADNASSKRVSVLSDVPANVTFSPVDQYVFGVVQNIVDCVCLHDARVKVVIERHEHGEDSGHEEDQQDDTIKQVDSNIRKISLQEEIMKIPLNPIPYCKSDCPDVKIPNELGIEAGRFGWCIVCRNTANLYCKDTRHPVCSQECKQKHLAEANALDGPSADNLPNFQKLDDAGLAFTDAILVFRSIVKLSVG